MGDINKVKNFVRFYENDEIESLNILFGKNSNNNWFTQEELAFACDVNLFDKENLGRAQIDWFNSRFE